MAAVCDYPQHPTTFPESPERSYSEHNESQELGGDQWRALAKIVRDVGPNLSPDEELRDVAAAEAAVNAKDAERSEVVDEIREKLRTLTREYNQASAKAQRPANHPSSSEHDTQVRQLEQQQYSAGKQLNEEQAGVAKREVELGKWKSEKEEIGKVEVGEDGWADGKIIRLKLFAEAGFTLIAPKDASDSAKVLIRNDSKSDIHAIPIDQSRSKVNTANLLWSLASE